MSQRSRVSGFTLLELMVAIAIFAVLGVMSAQLLNNMIRQHDIIEKRGDRLVGMQRAMTIIQRDINQIWSRRVRSEYGDQILGSLMTGGDYAVEFTRTGWRNPLEHQRSELQRVAYAHREKMLYRYYWPVLDRAIDSEPVEQLLMDNVLAVEFEALDGYGDAYVADNANANPEDPQLQIAALSVRFDLEDYGEITRLWEVPASLDKNPGRAATGEELPGTENDDPDNGSDNSSDNNSDDSQGPIDSGDQVSVDPQDGDGQ